MKILLFLVGSFLISFLSIFLVIRITTKKMIGLDIPGERKIHKAPIPRLGGLGIWAGLIAVISFLDLGQNLEGYLISSGVIFLIGVLDDLKSMRWHVKMLGAVLAISIVIFYGNVRITTLGNLFGSGDLNLHPLWGIFFTYFSILGITCAINLIDGVNGLAAGISLIVFLFLAYFSNIAEHQKLVFLSLAFVGGLLAFMMFNFPNGKIFLGDSGSTLLGFSIAVFSIILFQGRSSYEPMVPVLLVAVPLFDTVRVIAKRILKGKNPFSADKSHLHHLLLKIGICNNKVSLILWELAIFFSLAAVLLKNQEGYVLLTFLVFAYAFLTVTISLLTNVRKNRREAFADAESGNESHVN